MRQNIDQNIDLPQPNSLSEISHPKLNLFHNRKVIFLVSVSAIVLFLLIVSLFVSKNRSANSSIKKTTPTPEKIINTPTPANQYVQTIDQIEIDINSGTLLEAPIIDDKIGL